MQRAPLYYRYSGKLTLAGIAAALAIGAVAATALAITYAT